MRTLSQVLIVLFCCFSSAAFTQQDASPAQVTPPTGLTTPAAHPDRRITLDVAVTDKSGNLVPGLQEQDFTVLDDKQPKTILSFRAADGSTKAADSPLQVILLVDAVNASFQDVGYQRQQLEKFLRRDGGQLPVPMSLVLFSDKSTEIQPVATRDGNSLADSLNSTKSGLRTIVRSQGFYGSQDRVELSLRTLEDLASYESKQPGRKLLIWLSPGWALLSGPGVELTAKNQEAIFDNVVRLSTALREARVTLYSIDPIGVADSASPRTFLYESYLKGVASARKVQNGNLALQVLAAQSGGRVLNSQNDISKSIANCLMDATAYYTLSFDSPPADGPNEYHNLQLKIDKPGLTARTRTGYYAQP
jgi:VWFA-related protein